MSSPPPPWESHPPLPEDGFYEADPDVDTGPVHIVTPADEGYYPPPPAEDTFAGRFTAPLTVDPRTVPVRPERARLVPIVAGVAGVLAVGLAVWLFWPSSDPGESTNTASTPTTTEKPVDSEAQAKLLRFLPPSV